jgi:hypothetical protein
LRDKRVRRIAVSTIDSAVVAPALAPTPKDRALMWVAQNWHMLGLGGLILVGLLVLRSTMRAPLAVEGSQPVELRGPLSGASDASPALALEARAAQPPPVAAAESLRKELAEAVQYDPRAAAGVLRSWLGSAS